MGIKRIKYLISQFLILSIFLLLASCGGGGGDGDDTNDQNTSGFAGKWNILETFGGDTCGDLPGATETYTITIITSGDKITIVDAEEGNKKGTISNNTATVTIDIPDGENGHETTTLTLTLSSDGQTLSATGSWTENIDEPSECTGTFTLSGTRATYDASTLCLGDWVQVNFLGTDDNGDVENWDADSTDPEGIGFVVSISGSQWVERDEYGEGEAVVYSYTITGNRFTLNSEGYTETGWLEFPDEDTMIEWWDYYGDPNELVAFKWKRI